MMKIGGGAIIHQYSRSTKACVKISQVSLLARLGMTVNKRTARNIGSREGDQNHKT